MRFHCIELRFVGVLLFLGPQTAVESRWSRIESTCPPPLQLSAAIKTIATIVADATMITGSQWLGWDGIGSDRHGRPWSGLLLWIGMPMEPGM